MEDLNKYLVHLANKLDEEGKMVCANAVDELIQNNSLTKVAQYVGVIGYVLKQNRAMCNCVRKKRASSDRAMQEIVLECLKEYQDGQDYQDTEWHSKYAQVITNKPDQFDKIHLNLLSQWGNDDQLESHIKRVEDTALLLHQNDVKEDVFMQVLSNVEDLGDILRKESASQRPFKLAAPSSPRSWWSQRWTPSEFSWFNPMSWRGRWQRGEDQDVMVEMSNVLEGITNIGYLTQKMKTNVHRLKNQVAGYMVGSTTDLPDAESPGVVNTIAAKIDQLDPSNWNKNLLAVQQLRHLLTNTYMQNNYNLEHVNLAISLVDDLLNGVNQVYSHIDGIQKNMTDMRQRAPVKGRDIGLTEKGTANPFGMSSPSEEFGVLERVLSRLYENPFDEQSHHYAQRMHARLDDRLRYIKNPQDEQTDQWLDNKPEGPNIPSPAVSEPVDTNEEQTENISDSANTLSHEQVQNAVDILKRRFTGIGGEQIAEILNAMNMIFREQGNPDSRLDAVTDALTQPDLTTPASDVAPEPINATPETTLETPTDVIDAPVDEPPAVKTVDEPLSVKSPVEKAPINEEPEKHSFLSDDFDTMFSDEFELEETEGRGDRKNKRNKKSGDLLMASVFDVIRIADALDTVDPGLGDMLDKFLEEQEDIMLEFPRFPSVSKVIKEKGHFPSKCQ